MAQERVVEISHVVMEFINIRPNHWAGTEFAGMRYKSFGPGAVFGRAPTGQLDVKHGYESRTLSFTAM